jgi:hypothetical protein
MRKLLLTTLASVGLAASLGAAAPASAAILDHAFTAAPPAQVQHVDYYYHHHHYHHRRWDRHHNRWQYYD